MQKSSSRKTTDSRKTIDLKIPIKKDGSEDNRYTNVQFCKNDGSRDMRTKSTNERK